MDWALAQGLGAGLRKEESWKGGLSRLILEFQNRSGQTQHPPKGEMGDFLNIEEVFKQVNISRIIRSRFLSVGERSYKYGRKLEYTV